MQFIQSESLKKTMNLPPRPPCPFCESCQSVSGDRTNYCDNSASCSNNFCERDRFLCEFGILGQEQLLSERGALLLRRGGNTKSLSPFSAGFILRFSNCLTQSLMETCPSFFFPQTLRSPKAICTQGNHRNLLSSIKIEWTPDS